MKIDYVIKGDSSVYAYCIESKRIEEVYLNYEINNPLDIFELYTIYQNYLPIGYSSMISSNLNLIECSYNKNMVIYKVDNLPNNYSIFYDLLLKQNKLLGYNDVKIIKI